MGVCVLLGPWHMLSRMGTMDTSSVRDVLLFTPGGLLLVCLQNRFGRSAAPVTSHSLGQ